MSFFVTADGGLTTAGYVGCVVLMVALVVIASVLSAQKSKGTGMDARKLAFCAMGMALAFVTSYVKVFGAAVRGIGYVVFDAVYCADCELVWGEDGYSRWFCLWTAAVYPGAVCAVAVPGVL